MIHHQYKIPSTQNVRKRVALNFRTVNNFPFTFMTTKSKSAQPHGMNLAMYIRIFKHNKMSGENLIICCLFLVLWSSKSKHFKCTPTQNPSHWVRALFHPPGTLLSEHTTQSFSFFLGRIPIMCSCGTLAGTWSFNVVEQSSSTRVVIKWKRDSLALAGQLLS